MGGKQSVEETSSISRGRALVLSGCSAVEQSPDRRAMFEGLAISGESIAAACERVKTLAHCTQVMTCETLEEIAFRDFKEGRGIRLLFKCENMQKVGAFKFRGAVNAVSASLAAGKQVHFVTESSGNHGQALALAAKLHGCKATVVMPNDAPNAKIDAIRGYRAEVVLVQPSERAQACERITRECGATLVHPSNDPFVMSGQGTSMVEFFVQAKDMGVDKLDVIVVPVGGGGLLSGVAVAAKILNPDILVIAGEPRNADDAYRSKATGKLQTHRDGKVPDTIAGGLKTTLGSNTWPVVDRLVDHIILVSESEIAYAMKLLFERAKCVVEPSGAVGLSAVLTPEFRDLLASRPSVRSVGVILSGGNFSSDQPMPWMLLPEP